MPKHDQVVVDNWYNTEKYYSVNPNDPNSIQRYTTCGKKLSFSVHFIGKGGPKREGDNQHTHPHEQALCIPQGDGFAIVDGKRYKTKEGDFFLIPSMIPHGYDATEATIPCWNLDIFAPARYEYEKENAYKLFMQGKNPMNVMISED